MKKLIFSVFLVLVILGFCKDGIAAIYDDFNDNSIDTIRWNTWGNNIITEQNGSLNFDGASTGPLIAGGLSSRLLLAGDFEITFDYKNLSLDSYGNPISSNPTGFMLQVNSPDPINQQYITPNFIGIGAQYFPSNPQWQFGSYFSRRWEAGSQSGVSTFSDDPLFGSMKITKTGSEIKTFFFNNSLNNWQTAATYNANDFPNIFSGLVEVNLKGSLPQDDIKSFHAELDNIDLNAEASVSTERWDNIVTQTSYGIGKFFEACSNVQDVHTIWQAVTGTAGSLVSVPFYLIIPHDELMKKAMQSDPLFLIKHPEVFQNQPSYGFVTFSPVDMEITDPDGNIIAKGQNGQPNALYFEGDFYGTGLTNDAVLFWETIDGNYTINLIPEEGAAEESKFSLLAFDSTNTMNISQLSIQDSVYGGQLNFKHTLSTTVPEPSACLLFSIGILIFGKKYLRKKAASPLEIKSNPRNHRRCT